MKDLRSSSDSLESNLEYLTERYNSPMVFAWAMTFKVWSQILLWKNTERATNKSTNVYEIITISIGSFVMERNDYIWPGVVQLSPAETSCITLIISFPNVWFLYVD